jgi:hypothetical protein
VTEKESLKARYLGFEAILMKFKLLLRLSLSLGIIGTSDLPLVDPDCLVGSQNLSKPSLERPQLPLEIFKKCVNDGNLTWKRQQLCALA